MILCDSNVWLALSVDRHAHHEVATRWIDGIQEPESVLFCRATQNSFLRLMTMASVMSPYGLRPQTNEQAWIAFDSVLADGRFGLQRREPAGLEYWWRRFASRSTSSPKLWMDSYLAAFAVAGGYQMVTTDSGFRQFEGLDLLVLGA